MYIRRKVFSRIWDEETNDERLFSVNEVDLEEVTFARKDYEGLTENVLKNKEFGVLDDMNLWLIKKI